MKLSLPTARLKQRAKAIARRTSCPHHAALDRVARAEGFRSWSHLAASATEGSVASKILGCLRPADMVLLGARPGHGKTLLGLGIVIEAARQGRRGFFFTLEENEDAVLRRADVLGADPASLRDRIVLDTSDDICADYVIDRMLKAPSRAVAVVDYLQLLDQRRRNPELTDQLRALKTFAAQTGSTIVLISQIDRSFERQARRLPTLADVRTPNPFDATLFTRACFLHAGQAQVEALQPDGSPTAHP